MGMGLVLSLLCLAGFFVFAAFGIYCKIRDKKFEAFLNEHSGELLSGEECEFFGDRYSADTVITRYKVCISVVILTHVGTTAFFSTDEKWAQILSCYICLTAGWWGFPWGPIKTVQSVVYNCSPETVRVRDLFR